MNIYLNDIKWFLNVYANSLKEGKKYAINELKSGIKKEYGDGEKDRSLLYTEFFGEVVSLDLNRFYLYIINWYEHRGTEFTEKDKYKFEKGLKGNPREIVPFGAEKPTMKVIPNKHYRAKKRLEDRLEEEILDEEVAGFDLGFKGLL